MKHMVASLGGILNDIANGIAICLQSGDSE